MFQKNPKILLSHILPITLLFIPSQTIHSSLFSPTVNFAMLHRSAGYTHSVASPPVHPPGKHLRSTTSSISTPHDTYSTQDSTHPYITILTTILNICWYTCWFVCLLVQCCIVIGAFVPSRGGQIYKSTPGARSQFRKLSFPFAG
jgi:hypothetical protein